MRYNAIFVSCEPCLKPSRPVNKRVLAEMLRDARRLLNMNAADYLLLLFLTTAGSVYAKQRIVEGPADTAVRLGGTVLLKCRVEDQVITTANRIAN